MKHPSLHKLLVAVLSLVFPALALADRIELTDGSVITGKLLSVEGGKLKVETLFAGTIEIAQAGVKTFSTDEAVNVGFTSGSQILGKVDSAGGGIQVVASDGQMTGSTGNVTAIWRQGADSPELRAAKVAAEKARRKWAYEAALALTGRTGGAEKFGALLNFKATLANDQDKLVFSFATERAEDNGVKTADRIYGSADYSSFFSEKNGWYVRTSLEKDKIKLLDIRSNTAFGLTHRLIKNARQELEVRAGTGFVYDSYVDDPLTIGVDESRSFSSLGLDLALLHSYQFRNAKLTNTVTYSPAFRDFSNFRIHHESALEVPLGAKLWKLKLGLSNDYLSEPPSANVDRLDTTYFTSLILNWQ